MEKIFGFIILFTILVTFSAIPQDIFADHSEVTIEPAAGSGAPGCEETAEGCYIPSTATVDVGGVVIMTNTDSAAHTFTSGNPTDGPDGLFDTSLLMVDGSYEWSPTEVGTVEYFCMVHPWMVGTIIVKDSGSSSTYTPPTSTYTPPTSSGTDWQGKYLEVLSDFNEVSAKVGDLQRENSDLKAQINEMQTTIDNLNAVIMEQVKVIYEWVLGK